MDGQAFQTFTVVFLIIMAIGLVIAMTRKGRVASAAIGSRRLEIRSPAAPGVAFARIARVAGGKFRVDDSDANTNVLVLASAVSFASWGFLYPVFIHADGAGSRIEVGCHSKFFQLGPLVDKWHRDCVKAIEAALELPIARVA